MLRFPKRTFVLACVLMAVAAAAFAGVASANYGGAVDITCTSATYNFTIFPTGAQDVLETVFIDGVVAAQATVSFEGPTSSSSTLQYNVPNDGLPHTIEANAYSLTNSTPVFGLPGVVTLTCGSIPPPPSVCTYTKGFYRNHAATTAAVIAGMGGTVQVGSTALAAAQAQAVLNATPGSPGNVTSGGNNLLLNLVQQVITAELNGARGSTVSADVQDALAATNAGVSVTVSGGQIQLSTALAGDVAGALATTVETFNSLSDCG